MTSTQRIGHVLAVDDDPDVLTAARLALLGTVERIDTASSAQELPAALASSAFDAVLLDMNFAPGAHDGKEGLDWLERIRALDPTVSVIFMTAYGGVPLAVDALKRGAVDFVLKPWQNEKLIATVSAAVALSRARRESANLKSRHRALAAASSVQHSGHIIGSAPALRQVLDVLERAAPTDANVLILGESGTGKELMAREIHRRSSRAQHPFVTVDLGAVPEALFESELFGHKRGAFTGANADRDGRMQAANGGTLFLDEIGNLPLHLQRKLLAVLERREVLAVGASKPVPMNVRLISATNRSRAELTREEVFRQDLLFRINTVEVVLPSLRHRREDIAALLEHFLSVYARKYNVTRRRLSTKALELLESYAWPGNVRELRHAIERATILARDEYLEPEDFPFARASAPSAGTDEDLHLERIERRTIERALARFQGNVSQAAAALGVTRPALYRRMAKYGL